MYTYRPGETLRSYFHEPVRLWRRSSTLQAPVLISRSFLVLDKNSEKQIITPCNGLHDMLSTTFPTDFCFHLPPSLLPTVYQHSQPWSPSRLCSHSLRQPVSPWPRPHGLQSLAAEIWISFSRTLACLCLYSSIHHGRYKSVRHLWVTLQWPTTIPSPGHGAGLRPGSR